MIWRWTQQTGVLPLPAAINCPELLSEGWGFRISSHDTTGTSTIIFYKLSLLLLLRGTYHIIYMMKETFVKQTSAIVKNIGNLKNTCFKAALAFPKCL